MLKVGITGGIGSGKSIVARVFETLGVPVYNADDAAKRLMQEDPELKEKISLLLGDESYKDGQLNRSWISANIFGKPDKVKALNALVHPATIKDAHEWMSRQTTPYSLKEAALIFESGSERNLIMSLAYMHLKNCGFNVSSGATILPESRYFNA